MILEETNEEIHHYNFNLQLERVQPAGITNADVLQKESTANSLLKTKIV